MEYVCKFVQFQINANEAAERETSALTSHHIPDAGVLQREQERSRNAMQRVLVQKDYKQLLGSLSVLAKQNAVLKCFPSKSESKVCEEVVKEFMNILHISCLFSFELCLLDLNKGYFLQSKSHDEKLKEAIKNLIEDGKTDTSDLLDSSSADSTGTVLLCILFI